MLYVSTRDKTDSFTAYRVMHQDRAPDGGLFMPFYLPAYSDAELADFRNGSFSENLAKILNYFFCAHLNSWGIECIIGKSPVSIASAGQKVHVAELWHNPQNSYSYLEKSLNSCLCGIQSKPNPWVKVAIESAVLFGIFPQLHSLKNEMMDIAVDADDFSSPLSVLLARRMGLPIGNILCCFQENSDAWNFIHHGELSTAVSVPPNLERFIFATLGLQETTRYLATVKRKGNFKITQEQHAVMSKGLFPAVVGQHRAQSLITRASRSNSYPIDDSTAMTFGGLQDFRAKTGESRNTLLFAYNHPKE